MTNKLFQPTRIGDIEVANRVVMAPLTRSRADEAAGDVPGSPMNVEYYRQRSNAGLIISEGTQVSPVGKGYMATPGMYSDAQVEGWKPITQAVHAAGSKIVAQIWHVGRVTHPNLTGGVQPIAPSAVAPNVTAYTHAGKVEAPEPRALALEEIKEIVAEYRRGAANAIRAGFDGIELHGANGYLIDQFLRDSINDRDDGYGGSIAHRTRLLVEVMSAVSQAIGGGRTGLRLSPVTPSNDAGLDSDPGALMKHAVERLAPLRLAYLHLIEGQTGGARDIAPFDYAALRQSFDGACMVNNGYTRDMALLAVASGAADLVAFGKAFIANPDLGRRLREGAPLNVPDVKTFYGGGAAGYTDYPTLDVATA